MPRKTTHAVADAGAATGEPQGQTVHAPTSAPDLADVLGAIRYWHRQRVFAMDQRKRADLALGAFLRVQLGWSQALPKAEAAAIAARAAALIALGERVADEQARPPEKRKPVPVANDPAFTEWSDVIGAALMARSPFAAIEKRAVAEMERLASTLPVWTAFGEGVKGFGARSLAVIVAEAGDLSAYPTHSHLWKRMGLAVMDGVRQGGLRKTASAEGWIVHGYSARRRSFMFVIGDVLVKKQGYYREVYLARKEYERARAVAAGLTVAPSAKIPAKRQHEFMSDGHIHRRAQRYMEKRLLRHLWQAWRRAKLILPEGPIGVCPPQHLPRAA